jgi:15-cis-phytoene desaturase
MRFGFPTVPLAELVAEPAAREIAARGGEVRCGARVVALEREGPAHVAVLDDGSRVTAAHAVLALPPAQLESLAPGLARTREFAPSPYISVYTWFDCRLSLEPFWALQWAPRRMNYDFYDLANLRARVAAGSLVASNIIHSHRAEGLADEAIVRATVEEIAQFLPQARTARLLHADVHRIPMAICEPAPGSESARPHTRTPIAGLMLAGDWTYTRYPSSMESAARSGFLAAEAVLEDRRLPARIAQDPPANHGLAGVIQQLSRWKRRRSRHATGGPQPRGA